MVGLLIVAFLCLVGAILIMGGYVDAKAIDGPLCAVGISGMSAGIEQGLIESGVWKPAPGYVPKLNPWTPAYTSFNWLW